MQRKYMEAPNTVDATFPSTAKFMITWETGDRHVEILLVVYLRQEKLMSASNKW